MKCLCGCGKEANLGRLYILGHSTVGKTYSDETRRKMSLAKLGIPKSPEHRAAISKGLCRRPIGERKLCACGCRQLTNPGKAYILGHNNSGCRYHMTEEQLKKRIKSWGSNRNENVRNMMLSRHNRPTKPELIVMDIIKDYSLPFKYNGNNGDVIVGGLCPDFISTNGVKMVILVDGGYFHSDITREIGIDEIYRSNGYEPLHFTDTELYNSPDNFIATEIELKMKRIKC